METETLLDSAGEVYVAGQSEVSDKIDRANIGNTHASLLRPQ